MFQYPFQHRNHERIGPTSNKSLDIGLKATSHELGAKYFVLTENGKEDTYHDPQAGQGNGVGILRDGDRANADQVEHRMTGSIGHRMLG